MIGVQCKPGGELVGYTGKQSHVHKPLERN